MPFVTEWLLNAPPTLRSHVSVQGRRLYLPEHCLVRIVKNNNVNEHVFHRSTEIDVRRKQFFPIPCLMNRFSCKLELLELIVALAEKYILYPSAVEEGGEKVFFYAPDNEICCLYAVKGMQISTLC